jgi:carotenoid cleavage dioxygenase-like enzyme
VGVILRSSLNPGSQKSLEYDPCYVFHPMNVYEDGDRIVGDVMQYDAAPLFPDPDGRPGDPTKAVAYLTRWTFDLNANTSGFKREHIDDLAGAFPRFDERSAGLRHQHGFFAASSDSRFVDQFDTLAHLDLKTNKRTAYKLPNGDAISEPIFIPRDADAREGDGYLLATIYRGAERRSDLAVFDTVSLETGPIALAELSHRVPFGFHSNWRPDVGN